MTKLFDLSPFIDCTNKKYRNSFLTLALKSKRTKITEEGDKYLWVIEDTFIRDRIRERPSDVAELFKAVLDKDCVVEIIQDEKGFYDTPLDKEQKEEERKQAEQQEKERHNQEVNGLYHQSRMPNSKKNKFTFDLYKCGKDNAKALEIIKNYKSGFLTICGSTGLGKTHLAIAVGREFVKQEETVVYYQVEELMDVLRHSYDQDNDDNLSEKIDGLKSKNLLILDDFGTQKNTDWVLSKLDTLIDYLYINEKNLIITSNLSLKGMSEISERIASRLSSGQVVTLTGNDYRATHKEVKDDTD
jgi:DNA replication protein DnaC